MYNMYVTAPSARLTIVCYLQFQQKITKFSHYFAHTCTCTGTYNNQYMVLDLQRVELKNAVHDGALWVVEQIPGYTDNCILLCI